MRQFRMYLDKRRTFRLTPRAIARDRWLKEGCDKERKSPLWNVAASCWLFLIDEDPELTVERVEKILTDYLARDVFGFRRRAMIRLRTRLGAMLQQYREEAL